MFLTIMFGKFLRPKCQNSFYLQQTILHLKSVNSFSKAKFLTVIIINQPHIITFKPVTMINTWAKALFPVNFDTLPVLGDATCGVINNIVVSHRVNDIGGTFAGATNGLLSTILIVTLKRDI